MNIGKALLLAVIVAATGLIILPNTVSIFAGQHYWYNISGNGNQIPCQKCHADIFEELKLSNFHKHFNVTTKNWTIAVTSDNTVDQRDCEGCHRANVSITYAEVKGGSITNLTVGVQAHAASVVACMLCHQFNASSSVRTLPGPPAGGFNISSWIDKGIISTPYNYTPPGKYGYGIYAAHSAFIAEAIKNKTMQDSNEACIACHTHVAVKITWEHATALEFSVKPASTQPMPSGAHNWTISDWKVNTTYVAVATVWGNTTGYGSTSYYSNWPGNITNISSGTSIYSVRTS